LMGKVASEEEASLDVKQARRIIMLSAVSALLLTLLLMVI